MARLVSPIRTWLDAERGTTPMRDAVVIGLVALGIRVLAAASVWTYLAVSGRPWIEPDEGTYLREAGAVASGSVTGYVHDYGRWLGYVFKLTGEHAFVARGLSVVFGALGAVLAYELVRRMASRRTALLAGIAVAAWPSLVLWSVLALRDAFVVAVILASLLGALMASRGSWGGASLVFANVVIITYVKPFVYVILCAALVALLANTAIRRLDRRLFPLALVILAVGILGQHRDQGYFGVPFALGYGDSDVILAIRSEGALGGSTGFGPARDESTPTTSAVRPGAAPGPSSTGSPAVEPEPDSDPYQKVIDGVDEGLIYGVLGPFPGQPDGPAQQLLVFIEIPFWFLTIGLAGLGAVRLGWKRLWAQGWVLPLAFMLGVVAVLATYSGNAGTAFRQRSMIIPLALALAVQAWRSSAPSRPPADLARRAAGRAEAPSRTTVLSGRRRAER